jgi:Glutaredoxin-like domain (DUF836)
VSTPGCVSEQAGTGTARVVVLTRDGCHLCDQAVAVVQTVCAETGDSWTTRDVDADPELLRRYTDEVPVTFVDGAQHDFWRVDPVRLRAALDGGRPKAAPR